MSVKVSSWVWHETPAEVKGNRLVALLALADIADDFGVCRFADDTSQAALAAKARMQVSTFREATRWLVEHGYIEASRESATSTKGYRVAMEHRRNAAPDSGGRTAEKQYMAPPKSGGHSSIDVIDVVNARFAEFWKAYPRHVGKAAAARAFEKAVKAGTSAEVIVGAAVAFAADPNLPETRFIPHPTTWLNQGRWEDDPLPARGDGEVPPEDPWAGYRQFGEPD